MKSEDRTRGLKRTLISNLLLAALFAGCGRMETRKLEELENEAAGTLARCLALYEAQLPETRPTNIAQIFTVVDLSRSHRSHPYWLQQQFLAFGQSAGFSNSIYEKYVFVSGGVTNQAVHGEWMLMNALPFRNPKERMCRVVVWKAGREDYRTDMLDETEIQASFGKAGISVPKPTPTPPAYSPQAGQKATYSFATKVQMFFRDVAEHCGPGRFFWLPMMLLCGFVVLVIAVFLCIWVGRRGRH